jgi:regulator of protease activity HflC (stomatin/prohibitin superfamily)
MRLGVTRRVSRQDDLQRIIDDQTDSWGIKVSVVEVKGVEM